ncbi:hypothetical protein AN391_01618 [Pseudoalteromonas sp. P1-13-1a]|uniref:Uncharacterized protein n=1 Tax=Pseudoalteromonas undina TaxID=43660 RepID=A0ACC6R5M5_9GAMM|nr:hypothetical protein [Pseudoalteromonas sp. P1-13-1a]KPZ58631.1 hypothetical protein AN391_01618 [Pseudoalteromonas sp. P1-13-1a]
MFLTDFFGYFSLSALNFWAFSMAFLFNLFVYSLGVKRETTLLISSFIMMVSYGVSDYSLTWISINELTYLDWALYDAITIALLLTTYKIIKKVTISFAYLITGLSINMCLLLAMHLDVFIFNNRDTWLLWDIYGFAVSIIDILMIVALIVDRDFLGLHRLKNKLFGLFKSSKPQPII